MDKQNRVEFSLETIVENIKTGIKWSNRFCTRKLRYISIRITIIGFFFFLSRIKYRNRHPDKRNVKINTIQTDYLNAPEGGAYSNVVRSSVRPVFEMTRSYRKIAGEIHGQHKSSLINVFRARGVIL